MSEFNMDPENFQAAVVDLLVDILATNRDILERLDAVYDFEISNDEDNSNRIIVLEYLQAKHGKLPKALSDILKRNEINKKNED